MNLHTDIPTRARVDRLHPAPVRVPDLPSDVASSVGKASIQDRGPSGRLQGTEGQNAPMRQYARRVDHSLRPLLNGRYAPGS